MNRKKFSERIMRGEFPDDDKMYRLDLENLFYGKAFKHKINLDVLYNKQADYLSRIRAFEKYFSWKPLPTFEEYAKSDEMSSFMREVATKFHQNKMYDMELRACNIAVCFSASNTERVKCYAARSAPLFNIKNYSSCMEDIKMVLKGENVSNFPLELNDRLTECQHELDLNKKKEEELPMLTKDRETRFRYRQNFLFRVKQPNPFIPCAENFIEISENEVKGRHIRVTRDIPAGTVVAVEQPYAKVLFKELKWDAAHCHYCFKKLRSGIPCPNCVFTLYCGEECMEKAFEIYHRLECPCFPFLHATQTPRYVQLAFRMVLRVGSKELYRLFSTKDAKYMDKPIEVIRGVDPDTKVYDSQSYLPIFHLVAHSGHGSTRDFEMQTSVVQSIIFSHMLAEKTTFFSEITYDDRYPQEAFRSFVAATLLRHFHNVPCNSISIDELRGLEGFSLVDQNSMTSDIVTEKFRTLKNDQYGSATYALSSLVNHSCEPTVTRVHDLKNGTMALVTLQSISAGEELSTSYSRVFLADDLQDRLKYLTDSYNFLCNCVACSFDWPKLPLLNEIKPMLCCKVCAKTAGKRVKGDKLILTKTGKCPACKAKYNIEALQKEFGQKMIGFYGAYETLLINRPIDAIRQIAPIIQFFQFNIAQPFSKTYISHDILKQALELTIYFSE